MPDVNQHIIGLSGHIDHGKTSIVNFLQEELKGQKINTGTFFMNRCDYLDPGLAWTGVKDTGVGVTLSVLGFDHVTRAKSYHYRTV